MDGTFEELKLERGWKKYRKKEIRELIKKIKDSGDEEKIKYVKNLNRYYSILFNLNYLVRSHPIITEKEDKYGCEEFYNYLIDDFIDTSQRIINAIISAVANDEPLDSFHKFLMFPETYEEEYKKDMLKEAIDNEKEFLKKKEIEYKKEIFKKTIEYEKENNYHNYYNY